MFSRSFKTKEVLLTIIPKFKAASYKASDSQ